MTTSTARPSDRFIPYYFVLFFLMMSALMAVFVWLALRNYPGEVTREAYKKGLTYNQTINRESAQEKLGWNSDINFTTRGLVADVTFKLSDKKGQPVTDASVQALFFRPTHAGHDQETTLKPIHKGEYAGSVKLAWPGEWEVHVSATVDGHNYQQVKNINLQN